MVYGLSWRGYSSTFLVSSVRLLIPSPPHINYFAMRSFFPPPFWLGDGFTANGSHRLCFPRRRVHSTVRRRPGHV